MSEFLGRFLCQECLAEFDSMEELDKHNERSLEPQPTLPSWDRLG